MILAAGYGTRLRPLTNHVPKALCPVGNVALLGHAISHVTGVVENVAVNAHYRHAQVAAYVESEDQSIEVSVEHERALGTAGGVANLSGWLAGRGALVVNADMWHQCDLHPFVTSWNGDCVSILTTTPEDFGPTSTVVASILPASSIAKLSTEPSGLWEALWRDEVAAGLLATVHAAGPAVDCGTPADYLRANMAYSGGQSVVSEQAEVLGEIKRCVVWAGAQVDEHEQLTDTIRTPEVTVSVR